jgi:hypothetical protein
MEEKGAAQSWHGPDAPKPEAVSEGLLLTERGLK